MLILFSQLEISDDGVCMVGQCRPPTEYFSVEDASSTIRSGHESTGNMEQIINNLERELEEAQAAHAALYLELEKERSAAATAADEAMAMILRLQSEKAAVEMEFWQYQRMIEEKSAYDEEEMEILKDIIVRRERETHVLEKEVEAYKKMVLLGEVTGQKPEPVFDSCDDPTRMLKTICDSIGMKENVKGKMKWADGGVGIRHLDFADIEEDCNIEFQEKGIVTVDVYPSGHCQHSSFVQSDIRHHLNEPQELRFCKESSCSSGEEMDKGSKAEMKILAEELDGEDLPKDKQVSDSPQFEIESSLLDVHVIEDKSDVGPDENGKESNNGKERNTCNVVCASETSGSGNVTDESCGTSDIDPSARVLVKYWAGVEQEVQGSYSVLIESCKPMDRLGNTASYNNHERSSMSAIDSEKIKLEAEVENLRKRPKTIPQGGDSLT